MLAWYVNEATLRHVRIQGRNTAKKTMSANLISLFTTARKIAGIYWVIFSCFNFVYCPVGTMII